MVCPNRATLPCVQLLTVASPVYVEPEEDGVSDWYSSAQRQCRTAAPLELMTIFVAVVSGMVQNRGHAALPILVWFGVLWCSMHHWIEP